MGPRMTAFLSLEVLFCLNVILIASYCTGGLFLPELIVPLVPPSTSACKELKPSTNRFWFQVQKRRVPEREGRFKAEG